MSLSVLLFCASASVVPQVATPMAWSENSPVWGLSVLVASPDGTVYVAGLDVQDASPLYRAPDSGNSWTKVAQAPSGEIITDLAIDPVDPLRMIALTESAQRSIVYRTSDAGGTWESEDPLFSEGADVWFDTTRPGIAYALDGTGLYRSDARSSWSPIYTAPWREIRDAYATPDGELYWTVLEYKPPIFQVVATYFRSSDAGRTYTAQEQPFPDSADIAWTSSNRALRYRIAGCGIEWSSDSGTTWERGACLDSSDESIQPTQLAVDPESPERMFALDGTSDLLFASRDSGMHWTRVATPGGIPSTIWSIAFDARLKALFAHTAWGLFRSDGRTRSLSRSVEP